MMRVLMYTVAAFLLLVNTAVASDEVRFVSVDIYLESAEPVAAWQFEFTAVSGSMQVVGVENGESPAFNDAPYYDREALQQGRADRIVVADYSLREPRDLPRGEFRVATLHLMLGKGAVPEFKTRLVVATTQLGSPISTAIRFELSSGSEK